jgi:hypothetical protein
MCLAMNPDKLAPGERCASTSNRNFEGRQGKGGRTHLVSPAMAAAAAIAGHFVDIRDWVVLPEDAIDRVFDRVARQPGYALTVDLQQCQVRDDEGWCVEFTVEPSRRERMLNGWDDIAMTLRHEDKITAYEQRRGLAPVA